jgi:hypothetical protein
VSRQSLAERTANIAAKARAAERPTEPQPSTPAEPVEYPTPARHWWRIHRWGEDTIDVCVVPAQTQAQMRTRYPDAAGILPVE